MKGRDTKKGSGHSADLLVCFPSRAHLALSHKPICSPARLTEPKNCHLNNRRRRNVSRLAGGQASPLLWAKTNSKQMSTEISEPTSPKVTCAGQIKVRPRSSGSNPCKSWQSVMEDIERIHNSRSQSKFLGFKKDVLNFLTCLRNIRFDFRCFGSSPRAGISSDNEQEEEIIDDEEEGEEEKNSRTVFSKWFMVLQDNQSDINDNDRGKNNGFLEERGKKKRDLDTVKDGISNNLAVPPPNALLLMRCRSAPAKKCLEEKAKEEEKKRKEGENDTKSEEEERKIEKKKDLRSLMEEERMEQKENLVVMRYDTDFYKLSADIAKETWVIGGIKDPLSRSRSWKR